MGEEGEKKGNVREGEGEEEKKEKRERGWSGKGRERRWGRETEGEKEWVRRRCWMVRESSAGK